jgi:hypothetical protein
MRRFRFSIASLLGVVLFVAVGVAALRAADDAWDCGVLGQNLLALLTAVLLAVHRADRKRAFWLGFVLFGGVYEAASLIPAIEGRLPTSKGLAFLDSKVPGRPVSLRVLVTGTGSALHASTVQGIAFSADGTLAGSDGGGVVRLWDTVTGRVLGGPGGSSENFQRIGHSLLALILAFAGGHLSRALQGRRPSPVRDEAPETSRPPDVPPIVS